MIYVLYGCLVVLVVAMSLVLVRLQSGPTNLDRAVALDVITSATVGILVVTMALTGRVDLLPLLVVLASVGFISSTTIARFSQAEAISARRVLTPEEAARTPAPEFLDSDAPLHPDADAIVRREPDDAKAAGRSGKAGEPR